MNFKTNKYSMKLAEVLGGDLELLQKRLEYIMEKADLRSTVNVIAHSHFILENPFFSRISLFPFSRSHGSPLLAN